MNMYDKLKTLLANLTLLAVTMSVCFLVLEFVVFRMVLKPDDVLNNVTINNVVRYKPNTTAFFRHPDGRETLTTVNAQGWNSELAVYSKEKKPNRLRIAVVGDSYVHGAFVDVHDGFPAILKSELRRLGHRVEVYRFGMDGAPLSQYLNVVRNEVLQYKPDIVLIPLIHNDFDETYRFLKTRYASSFMKLKIDDDGSIEEIPATDFSPGLADLLRKSATFRYLYYETNLYLKVKGLVSRLFWGGDEDYSPEYIQSAVDIRKIKDHKRNKQAAIYVIDELKKLGATHNFKLAFIMDGVREGIYNDRDISEYEVAKLNDIARDVTTKLDVPLVDMHQVFAQDFAAFGEKFEYDYDWHWNRRGNWLVARAAANLLTMDHRLLGPVKSSQLQRSVVVKDIANKKLGDEAARSDVPPAQ